MLGRFAIPHIAAYIVFLLSLAYVLWWATQQQRPERALDYLSRLELVGALVLKGEVWRVLTFVVIPPLTIPSSSFSPCTCSI